MTEVGIIPEEWEVLPLAEGCWFQEGPGLRKWQFTSKGMKVINVTNLVGGILNLEKTDRHIRLSEFSKTYQHFAIDANDIVMASSGNSYGKVAIVRPQDLPLMMNTSVIRFKPLPGTDHGFLWVILNSDFFKEKIDLMITGGAQPNFGPYHLKRIIFPRPSLSEQRAIATALSDMDALISGLDQLIAKKRDIKQATMQQLLTGQTRLPGFSGDWVTMQLSDIGLISGAGVDKKIRPEEQIVRLLNYMDVYRRNFLYSSFFDHVVSARDDQIARCSVKNGDIFFTPSSEVRDDIGHAAVACEDMPDVTYSYHVVRLRPMIELDRAFSGFVFQSKDFRDQASTLCEGSGTRYVITLPKFRGMTIRVPVDKSEQAAIGNVLLSMSDEISMLSARREKALQIKQGMMQELLTGRIRLL